MNKIIFFVCLPLLFISTNAAEALKRDYSFCRKEGREVEDIYPLDDKVDDDWIYDNFHCLDHFDCNFLYRKEKIWDPLPDIDKKLLFLLPPALRQNCCYSFNIDDYFKRKISAKEITYCRKPVHYQGYLDPDFKKFNPQLKEMLQYFDETGKECTCFWPEYVPSAAKINNLAYELFEDLFSNSVLSILIDNQDLQQSIIGNCFWNLNLHGLSVSTVCQSFWFSHYYEICQMLMDYSQNEKTFSAKELKKIGTKIDNILLTLAQEFEDVYLTCLQKHPSSIIMGELTFLQGLLNFSSNEKYAKHAVSGIENDEFCFTNVPLEFEFSRPKSIGVKIENVESNFYPSTGYPIKSEKFLSEFFLIQGLLYNDLLQYSQAIECLNKAINHNKNNDKAYLARSYAYFEIQEMDRALADYQKACDYNIIPPFKIPQVRMAFINSEVSTQRIAEYLEFSKGLIVGVVQGFNESTKEFTPSAILGTLSGVGQGLWHFVKEPYSITHEFAASIAACMEDMIEHCTPEQMEILVPELKQMVIRWYSMDFFEQGKSIGHVIGKYGVDILACTGTVKIVQTYRDIKYANASLTLAASAKSVENRNLILAEVSKRSSQRSVLFKEKKIKIRWDQQRKHIPGSHNFDSTRSIITLSEEQLEKLLSEKAGTGSFVNEKKWGEAGYKERIDFKVIIGKCRYNEGPITKFEDTTNGILHYDGEGFFHMIPSRPSK